MVGLRLTLKNSTFVPIALDPNAVINFEIKSSIVPAISSRICATLTKLKAFIAISQHIEIVEDYAFNDCTDMSEINLEGNNIHKFGVGVFSNTRKLKELHILGASLSRLDVDLFGNLGELTYLMLSASQLRELPIGAVKNLKKLEFLFIYSNDLTDLDAEGLVEVLPNLKSIFINDNNFHCDRLGEIIDVFKSKLIYMPDTMYHPHAKKRDYVPRTVNRITCLSQGQLAIEKLKKALAGELEEMKDLPLGREVIELQEIVRSGFVESDGAIFELTLTVNETLDDVYKKMSNLNETVEHVLQNDIRDSSEKLRKLEEQMKQMKMNSSTSSALIENLIDKNNLQRSTEPLRQDIIAVWVFIAILTLAVGVICFVGFKKFRKYDGDAPLLSYEYRIDGQDLRELDRH